MTPLVRLYVKTSFVFLLLGLGGDITVQESRGRGSVVPHSPRARGVVIVMGNDGVTDPPDGTISCRRFTNLWRIEGGAWRWFARHANVVRREAAGEMARTA
jgi:hypothetical protein